ncbi:MAG: acyltransferase, partial [Yaniella sp.]|nr:acyltransferase [Yaniella sp.]
MTTQTTQTSRVARHTPKRRYRPDLHGIRGLAILGVVLFHLFGNGRVSGGIDIFLTVSGFLFTAMLLREAAENDGRINFVAYFGRLFRRIFVPAAIVVVTTAIAGMIILPYTQHTQMLREAVASLLYYENLELINSQLSYDAAGPETSLFQHFWSLSVQGQFYLFMPFVILVLVWLARKRNQPAVFWLGGVLAVTLLISMAWAIIYGAQSQDEAYLATSTRLWQLA